MRGLLRSVRKVAPAVAAPRACLLALVLASSGTLRAEPADSSSEAFFERSVRPVLAGTCFRCHGGDKVSGGLRVDTREVLLAGGDSGPAIVPGDSDGSLLIRAVRRLDDVSAMPPDAPLTPQQIEHLAAWVKEGAPWPAAASKFTAARHWSLEPVKQIDPPSVQDANWPQTSVDLFILAKLEAAGLRPSPPADRRALLRRVTYDLTGLPPTAAEGAAFESDASPDALTKVIERLLASPRYGEHWGRHWLDVVRYADTAGENTDHPLPHAWRYRNWVIGALNADQPYDEFIRQQVAGDLLAATGPPDDYANRVVATGFLAIARRFGHDIDKDVHLTYEDALDTLGKSVLGLSIGCCRCHDHKYDPLTARDYYGLYGILASTRLAFPGCEPSQQPRDLVPLLPPTEIEQRIAPLREQLAAVDAEIERLKADRAPQARQFKELAAGVARVLSAGDLDNGESAELARGQRQPLDRVAVRRGEILQLSIAPRANHGADTTLVAFEIAEVGGQARRWNVAELVDDLAAGNPHADNRGNPAVWCFLDLREGPALLTERLTAINGRTELKCWRAGETPSVFCNASDRPVDVWTTLPARGFFMHPGPQGPVALAWLSPIDGTVTISGRLVDSHPAGGDGVAWSLEHLADGRLAGELVSLGQATDRMAEAAQRRVKIAARMPVIDLAYAATEGTPTNARIHLRGDPATLGDEVPRKFPDVLGGQTLQNPAASGRLELADWLTDRANPLTARVVVNRVWQWHFGTGLVKTPNDFGLRGAAPTHPELLDHLAAEFMASGWRIKHLHRLILHSATYQQRAANHDSPAAAQYAAFGRRRLSAEELRDTLLALSGELDVVPGEAHPFPAESTWTFTQHTPFAAEYETAKRSVYVMQKRNRRTRFFALFDGADPNASTPVRDLTTVPTQALFFLNDPFLHDRADKCAELVLAGAADDAGRLEFALRRFFGRAPTAEERDEAGKFLGTYEVALNEQPAAERHRAAWQALVRVLLSSNELLHVE